jgi:membrane protease YdiL (CAAX protease family)
LTGALLPVRFDRLIMDELISRRTTAWQYRNIVPLLEIAFVVLCVVIVEWVVLPIFGKKTVAGLVPVIAAFGWMIASHYLRRETPGEIGWRLDNFGKSLLVLLPLMLAATAFLVAVGCWFGSVRVGEVRPTSQVLSTFFGLFLWGLMQQYALQGFVNRRAQMTWGQGILNIVFVAAVFALLHLPNPWLTLATFFSGLMWAWAYQRSPNLLALGLSHAIMTVVLVLTVPYSALHGLKVGYGYFL